MPGVYTSGIYDPDTWEPVDIITVSHNEAISFFREIGVKFGQIFGGKSSLLEKKIRDLRDNIIKQAEALIKDTDHMIVGFDIETSQYGEIFILIGTGTLLKRKKMSGGRSTRRRS